MKPASFAAIGIVLLGLLCVGSFASTLSDDPLDYVPRMTDQEIADIEEQSKNEVYGHLIAEQYDQVKDFAHLASSEFPVALLEENTAAVSEAEAESEEAGRRKPKKKQRRSRKERRRDRKNRRNKRKAARKSRKNNRRSRKERRRDRKNRRNKRKAARKSRKNNKKYRKNAKECARREKKMKKQCAKKDEFRCKRAKTSAARACSKQGAKGFLTRCTAICKKRGQVPASFIEIAQDASSFFMSENDSEEIESEQQQQEEGEVFVEEEENEADSVDVEEEEEREDADAVSLIEAAEQDSLALPSSSESSLIERRKKRKEARKRRKEARKSRREARKSRREARKSRREARKRAKRDKKNARKNRKNKRKNARKNRRNKRKNARKNRRNKRKNARKNRRNKRKQNKRDRKNAKKQRKQRKRGDKDAKKCQCRGKPASKTYQKIASRGVTAAAHLAAANTAVDQGANNKIEEKGEEAAKNIVDNIQGVPEKVKAALQEKIASDLVKTEKAAKQAAEADKAPNAGPSATELKINDAFTNVQKAVNALEAMKRQVAAIRNVISSKTVHETIKKTTSDAIKKYLDMTDAARKQDNNKSKGVGIQQWKPADLISKEMQYKYVATEDRPALLSDFKKADKTGSEAFQLHSDTLTFMEDDQIAHDLAEKRKKAKEAFTAAQLSK